MPTDCKYFIYKYSETTIDTIKSSTEDKIRSLFKGNIFVLIENDTIMLSKDWFNQCVIFYYYDQSFLVICGNYLRLLEVLKEELCIRTSINFDYFIHYLMYQCPLTHNTFCKNIYSLRSGETVLLEKGVIKQTSSTNLSCSKRAVVPDIRSALISELKKIHLDQAIFHISSGLDSSILAILASELSEEPITLSTCITRGNGARDELDNVHKIVQELDAELKLFNFANVDVFKRGKELIKNAMGYPVGHPSHLVEFLLDIELSKSTKTIVTGKGPDECLAGYPWHLPEYSHAEVYQKRLTVTPESVIENLLCYRNKAFDPIPSLWKDNKYLSVRQRLIYDLLSISEAWNIIHSSIEYYLDIELKSPFMNSELRHALFCLPDNFKIKNGKQKWFLRETFKDVYPDYILDYPKKGLRLDLQPYFLNFTASELLNIIQDESRFVKEYLDIDTLGKMITETIEGHRNWGWQIWSIYLASVAYILVHDIRNNNE